MKKIQYVATCTRYNSAMGKGYGFILNIGLNDKRILSNTVSLDSLIVKGNNVTFSRHNTAKSIELTYNYFKPNAEPSLGSNGELIIDKMDNTQMNETDLKPIFVYYTQHGKSYRINIEKYTIKKP